MEAAAQGMITTVAVAECGCAVEAGAAGFSIRQCATHAAAPAMLAALEAILTIEVRADGLRGSGMVDDSDLKALRVCAGQARRVLALARGKVK